jgi:hypothetical protein
MSIQTFTNSGTGLARNVVGTNNFGLTVSSPYPNSLGQPFRQAIVSGSTRTNLVPFNLQNLSSFNGIYLAGISALTEIYPFSGWSNINTFLIENSKLANFNITLPENIGNDGVTTTANKGLFFRSNAAINNFSPRYHNPSGKTMQCLDFSSNNFNGYDLNIDATKKIYWWVNITGNTNLNTINFSGYQGGVGGLERKNSCIFSVMNNPQLTGITFWPNNGYGFSSYSINISGGGTQAGTSVTGVLNIHSNPQLKYIDSVLPDSPSRYTANIFSNAFVDWTQPLMFDNPYQLVLYNNLLTGMTSTLSSWPLNQCKKAPNRFSASTSDFLYFTSTGGKWDLSYLFNDRNSTKNDYYYLSGQVTSIDVTPDNKGFGRYVTFNVNPSRALMGLYVQNAGNNIPRSNGVWTLNDEGRFFTGFSFDCEDDEVEDIKKLRGKYKFQMSFFPFQTTYPRIPTTSYSAETLVRTTPVGTFTPTKPCVVYFQAENYLDLSYNQFTTGITESNTNNILHLPKNLHRFKMEANSNTQNILKKFSSNLNRNLVHLLVSENKSLTTWDGEVSGACKITYFNVGNNGLTGWTQQFSTEDTQYDAYSSAFGSPYYFDGGSSWVGNYRFPGLLANSTSSVIPYINMVSEDKTRIINYYRAGGDVRGFFARFGLFNNNQIKNIDLYKLYPFNNINLGENPITGVTNLKLHPNIYSIDLNQTDISRSEDLIPQNESWPTTLKILNLRYNTAASIPTLTSWTKSFTGLTSSTGVTPSQAITYTGYEYETESLILDFRGQYKLYGESGFDFIVRDLVTGKTNNVYFSGGSLLISGITTYNASRAMTARYNVNYALSNAPTQYTGFTLMNGNNFVVSDNGYMADWLAILTGQTLGETTGRGWYTDLYPSTKSGNAPITNPINFAPKTKRSSVIVGKCNELNNGTFQNDLSQWQSNSDWSWSISYGGSAKYNGANNIYSFPISQNGSIITDVLYSVSLVVNIDPSTTNTCVVKINLGTSSYEETFPAGGGTFTIFQKITCSGNTNFSIEVKDNNLTIGNVYINKVAICNLNINNDIFKADAIYNQSNTQITKLIFDQPVVSWSGSNWCNSSQNYIGYVDNISINDTDGFFANRWYLLSINVNVENGGAGTYTSGQSSVDYNDPLMGPRTASVFLGRSPLDIFYSSFNTSKIVPNNLLSDYRISISGINQTYQYNFFIRMAFPIADLTREIMFRTDNINCGGGVLGPIGEIIGFYGTITLGITQLVGEQLNQPNLIPQFINTDNTLISRFTYTNSNSSTTGGIEFVGPTNNWSSIKVNCTSNNNGDFCSSITNTPLPISTNWKYQIYITDGANWWIYRVTSIQQNTGFITLFSNTTLYPIGTNTPSNPNLATGPIYLSIIY